MAERNPDATDKERLDWLEEQIVDTIYMDANWIIDVRGNSVRDAIDEAIRLGPPPESMDD